MTEPFGENGVDRMTNTLQGLAGTVPDARPGASGGWIISIRLRIDGNPTRRNRTVRPVAGWLLPLMGSRDCGGEVPPKQGDGGSGKN